MDVEPRGLVFELLPQERVLVSFQGRDVTTDEWESYFECLTECKSVDDMRFLVCVEGTPPSAAVQARIANIVRGHKWRVALVSSSIAMRFAVSAFSLVNKTIKYFAPAQLVEALVHIGCNPAEQAAVQVALNRLRSSG